MKDRMKDIGLLYMGITGVISWIVSLVASAQHSQWVELVLKLVFFEIMIPLSGSINIVYTPYHWFIHGHLAVVQAVFPF